MSLYRIQEVSDLFVDACVRDEDCQLLLLSIYGRDGAILEFFASFTLRHDQGGLTAFTLLTDDGHPHSVYVQDANRLQKLTGRLPKANVFGNLVHAYLYDASLSKPDKANRTAWGVYSTLDAGGRPIAEESIRNSVWQQIKDLSPVPLLDAWRQPILDLEGEPIVHWMKDSLHPPLGHVEACRIELKPSFLERISNAVRRGALRLPGHGPDDTSVACRTDELDRDRQQAATPVNAKVERPPIRLGQVVMTPGAEELIARYPRLLQESLARHQAGDWGVTDPAENNRALRQGTRLLSAYPIDPNLPCEGYGDNTLWIITEWDRSVTTLLLPDEY